MHPPSRLFIFDKHRWLIYIPKDETKSSLVPSRRDFSRNYGNRQRCNSSLSIIKNHLRVWSLCEDTWILEDSFLSIPMMIFSLHNFQKLSALFVVINGRCHTVQTSTNPLGHPNSSENVVPRDRSNQYASNTRKHVQDVHSDVKTFCPRRSTNSDQTFLQLYWLWCPYVHFN